MYGCTAVEGSRHGEETLSGCIQQTGGKTRERKIQAWLLHFKRQNPGERTETQRLHTGVFARVV